MSNPSKYALAVLFKVQDQLFTRGASGGGDVGARPLAVVLEFRTLAAHFLAPNRVDFFVVLAHNFALVTNFFVAGRALPRTARIGENAVCRFVRVPAARIRANLRVPGNTGLGIVDVVVAIGVHLRGDVFGFFWPFRREAQVVLLRDGVRTVPPPRPRKRFDKAP